VKFEKEVEKIMEAHGITDDAYIVVYKPVVLIDISVATKELKKDIVDLIKKENSGNATYRKGS
jgi:3-mercaptopyruvate sulfurtransferase SseA